jgi:hypothetical protein
MKNSYISKAAIVAVLIVLGGFLAISNATDKEKTFNVSKGDNLKATISNGNLIVNTWEKSQAYIKAYNIDEDDLQKLKIEQMGNQVVVEFEGEDSDDFYLEVTIPSQFNLDLTSGGGNIKLNESVKGTVKVETGGGNISMNSVYGPVEINTGGGNIKLEDIGDKLTLSTGGGEVSIGTLSGVGDVSSGGGNISIKDVKSKVKVSTGGGNVSLGNVGGDCEVSTAGGNVKVGKASGSVEISTAGGNIKLEGANGKVEANTAGGNIDLLNITGTIDANTAGGNITAELSPSAGSNNELNTAGGKIKLVVPGNVKASITATVRVGKKINDPDVEKYIKSDFQPSSVDVDKSSKKLTKKFVLNGGGSDIELNSGGGKIEINKK